MTSSKITVTIILVVIGILAIALVLSLSPSPTWTGTFVDERATQIQQTNSQCDVSYPDVCIPPYPPDLDCGDISFRRFSVVGADPHGFDRDNDGVGCES